MLLERTLGTFMVQLLLLDQDHYYCEQVCSQINSKSSHFHCLNLTVCQIKIPGQEKSMDPGKEDPPGLGKEPCGHAVDLRLLAIAWDSTLVIYHPQQFFHPPENSYTMILSESPLGIGKNGDSDESLVSGIYKYGSFQEMLKAIEFFLISHPDFTSMRNHANLMCVLGTACPALRQCRMDKLKEEKLEQGLKVVQIDFCPPYFSDYPVSSTAGYTLSDAFLRLMADDLSHEELGVFLVPREDGTLQFRPIERADDLFECKPDHIRQFVELIRKWIVHTNSQYFVFIQCFAVPFSFIYTIAVQSDELFLIHQEGTGPRTISYNKELSHLLANLPGSCSVRETVVSCPVSHE